MQWKNEEPPRRCTYVVTLVIEANMLSYKGELRTKFSPGQRSCHETSRLFSTSGYPEGITCDGKEISTGLCLASYSTCGNSLSLLLHFRLIERIHCSFPAHIGTSFAYCDGRTWSIPQTCKVAQLFQLVYDPFPWF